MFKNPFSFDGLIRRTEFGLSLIIYAVTIRIINVMVEQSSGDAAFLLLALTPLLWFLWAQCAKRCHDVGNYYCNSGNYSCCIRRIVIFIFKLN